MGISEILLIISLVGVVIYVVYLVSEIRAIYSSRLISVLMEKQGYKFIRKAEIKNNERNPFNKKRTSNHRSLKAEKLSLFFDGPALFSWRFFYDKVLVEIDGSNQERWIKVRFKHSKNVEITVFEYQEDPETSSG